MDGSTLIRIKTILLDRRQRIGESRQRDSRDTVSMAENQAEMIDMAQALEHIDRSQSLAEQERRDLAAVERALQKLAGGTFGICEDCDEHIPPRRLMAVPEARLCARCQEFEEKSQSRMRGGTFARAS